MPLECDYDTYEEFRDAMNAWEDAVDLQCEMRMESHYERE